MIKLLDPLLHCAVFKDLCVIQQKINCSTGPFSLSEVIIIPSSYYFRLEKSGTHTFCKPLMHWMWKNEYWVFFNYDEESPDWCGSVDWVPSHKAKGCQFHSRTGHVPGFQDWSPVRPNTRNSNQFLSRIDVSFPLSLHFPLSKKKWNLFKNCDEKTTWVQHS